MGTKWALLFVLFSAPAFAQDTVKVGQPNAEFDPPALETEEPTEPAPDAMSIREAFAVQIAGQLSGRQARLFDSRKRYRERVIDEAIDRAITNGILDPQEAFATPEVVVAEIMGTAQAAADNGRPPRDWKAFFEALQPFLEWFLQLLAGFGVFG